MSLKNLGTRTITGIVFVATLISSMLIHPYLFAGLFFVVCILSTLEFNSIVRKNTNLNPSKWVSVILNGFTYLIITFTLFVPDFSFLLYSLLIILPLSLTVEMYRKTESSLQNIALNIMSTLYIAIPFGLLNYFYSFVIPNANNGYFLMVFFILIWANDTGAYLIGSLFGKHRFFERISPKKSWEGFWGGLFFSLIIGYFLNSFFGFLPFIYWSILNLIVIVSSDIGDLSESLIKRTLGIKDSGTILPGHGGMLDRFDAVIFSSPIVFIYLQLFNFLK